MRVGRDALAVCRLVVRGTDDDDVLAELRREIDTLGLELRLRAGALRVDRLEHALRERLELVAFRDRLRLAADGDHHALRAVLREAVADETLGRITVCALGG